MTSSNVSLSIVGDANSDANAAGVVFLINAAMSAKKKSSAPDSNTAIVLNSLKIKRDGNQINATITLPRETASNVMKDFGAKIPASKS